MAAPDIAVLYDYLDSVDLLRDAIDTELDILLFDILREHADALAQLLIRGNAQGRATKALQRLVVPAVTDLIADYRKSTQTLGADFAQQIIAWIEQPQKVIKVGKADKIKAGFDKIVDNLALNLVADTESYALDMQVISRNLLFAGQSGATVTKIVADNVANTGRETGTYFNAIAADAKSALFQAADQAAQDAFAFRDLQNAMRWVAFFTKTCPDCIDRHNEVKSYEEWQSDGLPRSGATVCRKHCHCVLIPDSYPVKIEQPLPRERARIEVTPGEKPAKVEDHPTMTPVQFIQDLRGGQINWAGRPALGDIPLTERRLLEKRRITKDNEITKSFAEYYSGLLGVPVNVDFVERHTVKGLLSIAEKLEAIRKDLDPAKYIAGIRVGVKRQAGLPRGTVVSGYYLQGEVFLSSNHAQKNTLPHEIMHATDGALKVQPQRINDLQRDLKKEFWHNYQKDGQRWQKNAHIHNSYGKKNPEESYAVIMEYAANSPDEFKRGYAIKVVTLAKKIFTELGMEKYAEQL